MKVLLATLVIGLSLQAAHAVQICPAGIQRIAPDSRYTSNGNGTITDNQTGSIWKQCSEGQTGAACTGTSNMMNWSSALSAGTNSSFAGFNDWRLPNAKELRSLIETGCHSPAINVLYFPNTPLGPARYWSSSSSMAEVRNAWEIDFVNGYTIAGDKSNEYHVRLVRGGP